tara:strand:+ start:784 stop:930 length:147 start_codon:yes stop_codon:yes gene_type:complete
MIPTGIREIPKALTTAEIVQYIASWFHRYASGSRFGSGLPNSFFSAND